MSKVISASITPLKNDGSIDKQGVKNVFDRNIKHGLDGAFILGTMGEWGGLSDKVKEEYVETACEATKGTNFELLVGVNATCLPLSLETMKNYSKYEFDSYVFMPPGKTSWLDPIKAILTVCDKADRPVYYYHCPPNNGVNLSLADFEKIMRHPNLKGIKNSASNMWLRRELIFMKKELGLKTLILEGQEWAVDEAMMAGYDGMVCGCGALCSKPMVGIARAAERGDYAEAVRLQNVLIEIYHSIYGIGLDHIWTGTKYALVKLGLIDSYFTSAQEMDSLTEAHKKQIDECLIKFKAELD